MKYKIKKILKRNYSYCLISIISSLFVLSGQSYAQWQNMNLPSAVRVNSIAVMDSNIFAATDSEGIFLSTDNGENWESSNAGLQSKIVHTVFIDGTALPAGQAKVFAGTEKGAFVSTNNGLSWDAVDSGLSGIGVWSFGAGNSETGDSTIFAGTWSGVSVSTDYGKSWKATSLSYTLMPVNSICALGNSVFASTYGGGVFYSPFNGSFWEDISIIYTVKNSSIAALVPVFSLAIIDSTVIAGGGIGEGDYYYAPVNSQGFPDDNKVRTGSYSIFCFAVHNAKIFAGDSKGNIYLISLARGKNAIFTSFSPSLINQAVYSLALNNSYIFAGTASGVWRLPYSDPVKHLIAGTENPAGYVLEQNYPNPFNPSTAIRYSMPEPGHVTLKVYDELGREIKTLVDEYKEAGQYEVLFNGSGLASGIYYYRIAIRSDKLSAGEFNEVKKLILMK